MTHRAVNDELRHLSAKLSEGLWAETKTLAFVSLDRDPESVLVYLACLKAGHAVAIIDGDMPVDALRLLIDRYVPEIVYLPSKASGPELLHDYQDAGTELGLGRMHRRRHGVPGNIHPEPQLLLSTSGSTGSPKFVRLLLQKMCIHRPEVPTRNRDQKSPTLTEQQTPQLEDAS